ncbi:MAG: hypothetical protein Q9193_001946 [Seirophora villosa]
MNTIRIAIVGLGRRTFKKALTTIGDDAERWQLVAAVDPDERAHRSFKSLFPAVPVFQDVKDMLEWDKGAKGDLIEAAYVAVPHHCYTSVVPLLLSAGIHVIKEKPAATSPEELMLYQSLAKANAVTLSIASQRRYGNSMMQMKKWLAHLGGISSVEAKLKLCISDLDEGWRSKNALAGGGAMADVGWHLLDTVIMLARVDSDSVPNVAYARLFHVRQSPGHDCEDSAEVILEFPSTPNLITAHLTVSRVGHEEMEEIIITGEKATMTFDGSETWVHFDPATGKESLRYNSSRALADNQSDFDSMFTIFHNQVRTAKGEVPSSLQHDCSSYAEPDLVVTRTLRAIYQHAHKQEVEQPRPLVGKPHTNPTLGTLGNDEILTMDWPKIDGVVEEAVIRQLHEDISIYGNGGVFKQFETEFKEYHGAASSHSLLHNSGTNALHALYFAAGLMPGDEVIFPVYTFHATCSPAMHFGIKPVFCDAESNGNISPRAISRAITAKTKAVVVTHMWGIPCDMPAICSALKQWPRVLLFEDCSHAHGAKINGQPVGTFGDGAAWSLQGQKIVTGGEGGITLTKHADFHYRQLILGHYNKRCKIEIPRDHPLHEFALTGAGLKNRAHPLAIAVALTQLRQLPAFHAWKTKYASQLTVQLSSVAFLELPLKNTDSDVEPAWYTYVMRFKAAQAPPGLTRESFVEELHAKGLVDVDIPKSTGLLHREPLYNKPQELLPFVYNQDYTLHHGDDNLDEFGGAQAFYDEAIKFPVYATAEGQAATDRYVKSILEIANAWLHENTH